MCALLVTKLVDLVHCLLVKRKVLRTSFIHAYYFELRGISEGWICLSVWLYLCYRNSHCTFHDHTHHTKIAEYRGCIADSAIKTTFPKGTCLLEKNSLKLYVKGRDVFIRFNKEWKITVLRLSLSQAILAMTYKKTTPVTPSYAEYGARRGLRR